MSTNLNLTLPQPFIALTAQVCSIDLLPPVKEGQSVRLRETNGSASVVLPLRRLAEKLIRALPAHAAHSQTHQVEHAHTQHCHEHHQRWTLPCIRDTESTTGSSQRSRREARDKHQRRSHSHASRGAQHLPVTLVRADTSRTIEPRTLRAPHSS